MEEWRSRLVEDNQGLVKKLARDIHSKVPRGAYIEYDDLVGWGNLGLTEAASRFDPRRGIPFGAFAYYRIRGAMFDALRRMGYMQDKRLKMYAAMEEYLAEEGHDRRPLEVLNALAVVFTLSLDQPLGTDEDDGTIQVPDATIQAQEDSVLSGRLRQLVDTLPQPERDVVKRHYFDGWTFVEIAKNMDRSKAWVSRLHSRAMDRLRQTMEEKQDWLY